MKDVTGDSLERRVASSLAAAARRHGRDKQGGDGDDGACRVAPRAVADVVELHVRDDSPSSRERKRSSRCAKAIRAALRPAKTSAREVATTRRPGLDQLRPERAFPELVERCSHSKTSSRRRRIASFWRPKIESTPRAAVLVVERNRAGVVFIDPTALETRRRRPCLGVQHGRLVLVDS